MSTEASSSSSLAITEEQFLKFREFYYRKTGTYFDDSKRYFVDKRLIERIKATESEGFRDYFVKLRFETDGQELQSVVNLMTVNETFFFREEYQFKSMVSSMLPEVLKHHRQGEPIRIWSVPCSTGEEPYSIAIYLLENWPELNNYDVEVIASDIDTKAMDMAKKAEYGARAVGQMPKDVLARYFVKMDPNRYLLKKEVREVINFTPINVADYRAMSRYRNFDLIFCRNLLIYFDDNSRRQAAESLYDALKPGGFICLGHSESMSRISPLFKVRKFNDAIVYQKPLG